MHQEYIDIGSSADIIYEHCFRLLPGRWKESLKPATRILTGCTWHNLWPLGKIQLPFTLTNHDKTKRKTTFIDFVVIRHPTEHNIILRWTALLQFSAVPLTMQRVIKFSIAEGPRMVLAIAPRELRCYEIM